MQAKVDVIAASGTPSIRSAQKATSTIPIVFVILTDPVALRLVQSLARPGGNMTGLASQFEERITKQLQPLKEAVPNLSRVAPLHHTGNPSAVLTAAETAATSIGLTVRTLNVTEVAEFENAFKVARSERMGAVQVMPRGRWGGGLWLRPLRLTPIKPASASTETSFRSTARCASRPPTAPDASGCCATRARPPFALDRLRQLAPERLIYDPPKPGPCALRSPPSRWPRRLHRRPHRRQHRPIHPPPNRPTAAPPAMPGRCCSPASMSPRVIGMSSSKVAVVDFFLIAVSPSH